MYIKEGNSRCRVFIGLLKIFMLCFESVLWGSDVALKAGNRHDQKDNLRRMAVLSIRHSAFDILRGETCPRMFFWP